MAKRTAMRRSVRNRRMVTKAKNEPKRKPSKKSKKKTDNPWMRHVMMVLKDLKKKNPKAGLKEAIPIAKKSYKKNKNSDNWNVPTSQYSTVTKPSDNWNVSTSQYSTVTKPKGKKTKGKKTKISRSRRRR